MTGIRRAHRNRRASWIARTGRLWRVARREPRFRLLLLDNLVTTLGASFTLVALPFLVMRLSGRALDLGITMAIEALPSLALLIAFPRLLDRRDPLRVLRLCRWCFVGINGAVALLTGFERMSIPIVSTVAMLGGVVWALAFPAGRTVFSLYIRKGLLPAGNAMFALISAAATVVLPLVAGSLVLASRGNGGLAIAFAIDAMSVAVSLPLLGAVGRRGPVRRSVPLASAPVLAAPPPVVAAPVLSRIPRRFYSYLLVSSVVVFGPVPILLPSILVARHDTRYLAIYLAQFAGVAAATAWGQGVAPSIGHVLRRILACWALAIVGYLVLGGADDPLRVSAAFFLLAAAATTYGIQSQSWLQRHAATQELGREMTRFSAVTLGAVPVAALLTGALVDAMPLASATALVAAVVSLGIVVGGAPALRLPSNSGTMSPAQRRGELGSVVSEGPAVSAGKKSDQPCDQPGESLP